MKKRIFSMTLILTLLSATVTGCGPEDVQNGSMSSAKTHEAEIHAKELTSETGTGICIDYAELSMMPVQKFAYDLLANHVNETNPVISPVSAYVTLCMLANGADGETKEQLQHVLGEDLMCLPDHIMNILEQNEKGFQMKAANSVWMDEAFTAEKDWLGTVKSLFDASVYQADLDTDMTKDDINQWVMDSTNRMIQKFLDKNLEESAGLALINALYFKADWMNKFEAGNTGTCEFHSDDGLTKKVPMMYQLYYDCEYLKDDVSEGVVLPYADSSYAFVAVKPLKGQGIREWYASCSAEKLQTLLKGRKKKDINLGLVKFTADCRTNLNDGLKKMGITRAFDSSLADFQKIGMSEDGMSPFLSNVFQEAVIEVTEEGTQAAAATIAEICDGGAMMDVILVTFDSPFLYMIMEMESEMPVFMGIMDLPQE